MRKTDSQGFPEFDGTGEANAEPQSPATNSFEAASESALAPETSDANLPAVVEPPAGETTEDATVSENQNGNQSPTSVPTKVESTFAGGTWIALIVGALLLIVLLVFILQNQQAVAISFFNLHVSLPSGVGFLFSAILGALIMALVGGMRMFQLRRQIKKLRKLHHQK